MRQHTPILLLVGITAYVSAQSQQIAPGAGVITGVPAPGSTVDNPQIDLTLFRPFCLTDMDCESGNCVDGVNDDPNEVFPIINVQGLPDVFYCGNPLGVADCNLVANASSASTEDLILEFARIDGICNNLDPMRQLYGSREHLQLRRMNGVPLAVSSAESGAPNQVDSVRQISDEIIDQISSIPNQFGASTLLVYMGQFIDHDLTLIEFLPPSERIFLQGTPPLEDTFFFDLSVIVPGSDPVLNPNAATAWADLSMVYGSDQETADSLRDPMDFAKLDSLFRGGQEFLPRASEINEPGNDRFVPTAMSPMIPGLFAAGDIRTNEQIMLASFHTLFMREHNRLVDEQIRTQSRVPQPTLNQCPPGTTFAQVQASPEVAAACELIYQLARRVNIAQWQKLVFVEYFDSWHNLDQEIGGPNSLPPFVYNDTLSPDIDIFFSTVTYRFGHTGVVNYVARLDPAEGSTMDSVFLGNAFFNPGAVVRDGGADTLLNGAANQCHERRDSFIVSGIRNFLFGMIPDAPDSDNMDLPSFNIERGRDHEVALYNDARIFYGLEPFTSFDQVVNAPGLPDQSCIAEMLQQTFGEVDNCDPFVCGLAEPSTRGELGELFFRAQDDQFQRCRDGDRFHYLNAAGPTPEQLDLAGVTIQEIENFQMQNVLNRNTFPNDGSVFNPSPFQTDACCLSTGDVSNTPVCVRETGLEANFRRFELVNLPICDALDQLDLLNFVAGTMNPQSFRPYSCSCRPLQDSSQMVLFNVVAQAVEQTGGIGTLTASLSQEMTMASQVSPDRFPMENMELSTDSQGNAEVMIEILPTMDPQNELTAEELVGVFERTNRLSSLGPNSLMAADNMNMVCINCPPLPNAQVESGAGAVGAAAETATLIGLPVAAGGAVLGAIGLVVLLAIGFGVRYRMKQNELPNFTSGQEAV